MEAYSHKNWKETAGLLISKSTTSEKYVFDQPDRLQLARPGFEHIRNRLKVKLEYSYKFNGNSFNKKYFGAILTPQLYSELFTDSQQITLFINPDDPTQVSFVGGDFNFSDHIISIFSALALMILGISFALALVISDKKNGRS